MLLMTYIHSLASPARMLARSLIQSLACSLAHSLTHSLTQVWMSHHPGKREGPDLLAGPAAAFSWLPGGRPAVHRGFLNSWRANGLNQRVKQRVWDILYSKDVDRSNVKVLCTGQTRGLAAPDCCAVASSHIFWVVCEQEGHSLHGLSSATPALLLVLLVCLYLTVW